MKKLKLPFICLLILFSLSSCLRRNGTLQIILDIEPQYGYDESTLKKVLTRRIMSHGDFVEIKKIEVKAREVFIELKAPKNDPAPVTNIVSSLLQHGKGLQFFETYEAGTLFEPLFQFSKKYSDKEYDSLMEILSRNRPKTLSEIMTYRHDSTELEKKRLQLLKGYLAPNISQGMSSTPYFFPGPILGYFAPKDSAGLFALLDSAVKQNIFPTPLVLMSGKNSDNKDLVNLYTLKLSTPFNKPAMEGDIIEYAHFDGADNQNKILFKFKGQHIKEWATLTAKNQGKSIAIVCDNQVLSAPNVAMAITDGLCSITGGFTEQEARVLAAKMSSGYVPCVIKIKQYEFLADD